MGLDFVRFHIFPFIDGEDIIVPGHLKLFWNNTRYKKSHE